MDHPEIHLLKRHHEIFPMKKPIVLLPVFTKLPGCAKGTGNSADQKLSDSANTNRDQE